MKICPQCTSDSYERTTSTGLRVVGCIALLFIPFGFLVCWVPFILPHKFQCNVCGYYGKEEELISLDWRESEELKNKHKELAEKLKDIKDNWVKDLQNRSYKIVHGKGQYLLLEVLEDYIKPYRIVGCSKKTTPMKIMAKDNLAKNFDLVFSIAKNTHKSNIQVNDFGRSLLTEEEINQFFNRHPEEFSKWLNEHKRVVSQVEIVFLPNTRRTTIEGKIKHSKSSSLFDRENGGEEQISDSRDKNYRHYV